MKTTILTSDQIDHAVALLAAGQVVAIPTETVYGLAADAHNQAAIQEIFTAKGRPLDHPLIVHIASARDLADWAREIPEEACTLADHFWPGPLTLILKKKDTVSDSITGGLDTIAVRVPAHPVAHAIIKRLGHGIVAPSANAHKKTSPTRPEHVLTTLASKIAAIIDGGPCTVGLESTIVDLTQTTPMIVRPGAITAQMLEQVLHIPIAAPAHHSHKVSGNLAVHYQPRTPLFLLSLNELTVRANTEDSIAIVHHSTIAQTANTTYYQMPDTKNAYARCLYDVLHVIDATDAQKIYVEMPPEGTEWADVRDRLQKAASK